MKETPVTVYGIRNCDTVKKARRWLDDNDQPYRFHDFKIDGVPADRVATWLELVGWETLVNRKGSTWRQLEEAKRAAVVDSRTALAVLVANPSAIKRPVVDWGDGTTPDITVGFAPQSWAGRLI